MSLAAQRRSSAGSGEAQDVIHYSPVTAPIGRIWLGATPTGICRIALGRLGAKEFVGELKRLRPGATLRKGDSPLIEAARAELLEYFSGKRSSFTVAVDLD